MTPLLHRLLRIAPEANVGALGEEPHLVVIDVELEQLVVDAKENARESYPEIPQLAVQIKRAGLIHPITVRLRDDDRFDLVAGYRRFYACERLNWKTIPASVWTGDDTDRLYANAAENIDRKNLTPFEISTICVRLRRERKQAAGDVARRLGLSPSYITNLTKNREQLHPFIIEHWKDGHPIATLPRLSNLRMLPHEAQLEEWEFLCERVVPRGEQMKPDLPMRRRPSAEKIEAMMKRIRSSKNPEHYRRGAIAALRWVIGERDTIGGVNSKVRVRE